MNTMTRGCLCLALCLCLTFGVIAGAAAAPDLAAGIEAGNLRLVPVDPVVRHDPAETLAAIAACYGEDAEGITPGFLSVLEQGELPVNGTDAPHLEPISFSPDGTRMLAWLGSTLLVADMREGKLQFPWRLADDLSDEMREHVRRMMRDPELLYHSWSADGNTLAFSSPRKVIAQGFFGANLWLADLGDGSFRPLFPDLPVNGKIGKGDYEQGVPYRAVFDAERPILYYDVYGALSASQEQSGCMTYAYDLTTGTHTPLLFVEREWVTLEVLHPYGGGLLTLAIHREPDKGVSLITVSPEGEGALRPVPTGDGNIAPALWRMSRLVEATENRAVLLPLRGSSGNGYGAELNLATVLTERMLLLVDPAAPEDAWTNIHIIEARDGKGQLKPIENADVYVAEMEASGVTVKDLIASNGFKLFNATFSPDGAYLLLVGREETAGALYLVDLATMACAGVRIGQQEWTLPILAGVYETPMNLKNPRGLQWLPDGRVLLWDGKENQLFEWE